MLQELNLVPKESGTLNDLLNGNNTLVNDAREVVKQSNMTSPGENTSECLVSEE